MAEGRISKERVEQDYLMRFFSWDHLKEPYQKVSAPFGQLAMLIQDELPRSAERTVALRKLLEAKDAAVRCTVGELDP
jgi:hypothetical protein